MKKMPDNQVVAGNTTFAFDLYAQLQQKAGNLFFSPYSVSSALAMTYAGTQKNTAAQMSQVLHFGVDQTQFHPAFSDLQEQINATQQKKDIALNVANGLWVDESYPLVETFLDLVKRYYQAELNLVDFKTAYETIRLKINAWVEKETNDKIQNLLKPDAVDSLTCLILVNAIYFKSNWASQFDEHYTQEAPFWVTPTEKVDVAMMTQPGNQFNYAKCNNIQVLELPYKGNEISMIVLLPEEKHDGLAELESLLSVKMLEKWLVLLQMQEVKVFLPKFKITTEFELSKTLAAMGMPDVFNPNTADFLGLWISSVIHKAFVEVNEEGTEAAAATAVELYFSSPTLTFYADHPFLFLIFHNPSKSILFLGRVVNPLDFA